MATLSVFLTNYNHGKEISRAIEAIISQSRQPDEFIIQDDGSTDNSIEIIMPYVKKHSFIRFVKNSKNLGPIPAMQKVSALTTGDYIYGAGADDWILPGFFEQAMKLAEEYPHAGMCCGDMKDYYCNTGEIRDYSMMWYNTIRYISPDEIADVLVGRSIPGQAAIMRRDAFNEAGSFITELKWHSDWFFTHVIAFRYGVVYIPESFVVETAGKSGSFCFEGARNPMLQNEVLLAALRLLKSPKYKDLLPYFMKSAIFSPNTFNPIALLLEKSDILDIKDLLLLNHSLFVRDHNLAKKRASRKNKSS